MKSLRGIGIAGGASLIAVALALVPTLAAEAQRSKARASYSATRPMGAFTPAVSDPRLAAMMNRRGTAVGSDFRFTPASGDRGRQVRVAIRSRSNTPAVNAAAPAPTAPSIAIAPSAYNLGVSLGWRRFAISGDIAQSDRGAIAGTRESTQVGMSYRATRRLTGRVAVGSERAEGAQRIITGEEAYSVDAGASFSIARNVDLTAGARYRIQRDDRLEAVVGDQRRDSQAVYVGTAFRF